GPFAAFTKFQDALATRFGSKYRAETVREVLLEIQSALRATDGKEEPVMIVGGSFVNGRSDLRASDIDIINRADLDRKATAYLNAGLSRIFRKSDPAARMEIEFHPRFADHAFVILHPVAFRVTPGRIELMIYEP